MPQDVAELRSELEELVTERDPNGGVVGTGFFAPMFDRSGIAEDQDKLRQSIENNQRHGVVELEFYVHLDKDVCDN